MAVHQEKTNETLESENMKKFNEDIKEQLEAQGLTDTVLEIGWNYLQAKKEGDSQ